MNYYDMNKCLCKELCCEFEKFEQDPKAETFHGIKELVETMVGLQELEAAGAMRKYLEDEHGYDSYTGEFREMMYPRYGIYNAAIHPYYPNPNPTYQPNMTGNRRRMDGRGYDDMDYDVYNRAGDRDDRRNDNRDGRDGRSRDKRGRYNSIYNMAHMDNMNRKEKLNTQEIQKWMDSLESDSGERGPMWTKDEVEAVAKKEGIQFDKFSKEALYAMTNVMYSDYCSTGEKYNVDSPSFYMALAVDFLTDPDAIGEGYDGDKKMAMYYENIAEH